MEPLQAADVERFRRLIAGALGLQFEDDRLDWLAEILQQRVRPRSQQAITNIRDICEEHLRGQYRLEVLDVYQRPMLAAGEQIIALPTLIRELPLPIRRFIGDLSDTEKILVGLDLKPSEV